MIQWKICRDFQKESENRKNFHKNFSNELGAADEQEKRLLTLKFSVLKIKSREKLNWFNFIASLGDRWLRKNPNLFLNISRRGNKFMQNDVTMHRAYH